MENVLLWLIRYYLIQQWGLGDDPSSWADKIKSLEWASAEVTQQWIQKRRAIFTPEHRTSWAALEPQEASTVMENFFNLIPLPLGGFFDDGFWAGNAQICNDTEDAVIRLMDTLWVQAQYQKFERDTLDGKHYVMKGTRATKTEKRTWVLQGVENVEILGKEFCLPSRRRGNATSRIKACSNLLDALEDKAASGKKRLVHRGALERLQGQLNFLIETSKSRRSYTKALTKCIAVELGEKRSGDGRARVVAMAIA